MTDNESVLPEPSDPEFIRMMTTLESRAEKSRIAKAEALDAWSGEATDEEIREELGLDMNALREDPVQDQ